MADLKDKFHEQMKALQKAYASELQVKHRQIKEIYSELQRSDCNVALLQDLHRIVHNIAGSGATLGFSALSKAAREFDTYLKPIIKSNSLPTAGQLAQIGASIQALGLSFENPGLREDIYKPVPMAHRETVNNIENRKTVFLVEDDISLAEMMAVQLGQFGYDVELFDGQEGVTAAVQKKVPAALIMDIMFPGNDVLGFETVAKIHDMIEMPLPVIFVSASRDFTARLQAVRLGGDAYFVKPVDIIEIVEVLDSLTYRDTPEPYRILIVEDEPQLAEYYSIILKRDGMIAEVVTDPMLVMQTLGDFNPDLIVMDVYMPKCSGLELAAVIRQIKDFVSVPIVFLSVETNIQTQLDAMRLGGDDFLTKPIQPDRLTSLVISRAQRARILRSHMTCDSLTGLLNHSTTKLRLDSEIARARRQNSKISFGLIDIDNFKNINDTFGHYAGDQVIKSLSRLLMQRLRKTDIVGRYGGEEFAVILPETDGTVAVKVLDEIRESFLKIGHQKSDQSFTVTFSCGIACFPSFDNATELINAADGALYEAKKGGRNKLILTAQ
ncbi:MAG: diguanylate cyclase [Nitrospirae bacterium]|nr:diguanylate cyclase [Nitrospirota bacterium]